MAVSEHYDNRRYLRNLRTLQSQGLGPSLVLQARSVGELQYWLKINDDPLGNDVAAIRSLLRILRFPPRDQSDDPTSVSPLLKLNVSESSMQGTVDYLLRVLNRAMEPRAKSGEGVEV